MAERSEGEAGAVSRAAPVNGGPAAAGARGAGRFSTWALAGFVCSVACCPVSTLLGVVLGARALVEIRARPGLRGRRLAIAAITIGSLTTVAWLGAAIWWHYSIRLPMMDGPRAAIVAGQAGDVAGFRAAFVDEGSEAEAAAFLAELSDRYGQLIEVAQVNDAVAASPGGGGAGSGGGGDPAASPAAFRIRYVLHFASGDIDAEAEFVTFAERRVIPRPICKWSWLRVIDPEAGDLIYPIAAP